MRRKCLHLSTEASVGSIQYLGIRASKILYEEYIKFCKLSRNHLILVLLDGQSNHSMSMRRFNSYCRWKSRFGVSLYTLPYSSNLFFGQGFSSSVEKYTADFPDRDSTTNEYLKSVGTSSSVNSVHDSLSIRPELALAEVSVALTRGDGHHLHSTVADLDRVGGLDSITLESCIKQCLAANDLNDATILLSLAAPRKLEISDETCVSLLNANMINFRWHLAAETLRYMIPAGLKIPANSVFRTFEGLMKDPKGVAAIMRVAILINVHKRGDLATAFNLNKVIKIGTGHLYRIMFLRCIGYYQCSSEFFKWFML